MKTKKNKISQVCSVVEAQGDQCFWVNNGPVVKNLSELKTALEEMSNEQFLYHTKRGEGNDFANWAEGVLGCSECAQALRKARTKAGAVRAIEKCCS